MARQQAPQRAPVCINDVVAAALEITDYALRSGGVEVVRELDADIPRILADADQLHQVFMNLIINAQQALQEQAPPRRIVLASRFDGNADVVTISVADNGPGIPEALRTRIFEPYFTTKPTGMGTGVGLSVSHAIVEQHGGRLTVDCPAEGGTRFTIDLPCETGDAAEADRTRTMLRGPAHSAVLVVDQP